MALLRLDGMLDPHTHLRDLSWAHKGTFHSETTAALAGGYWAVFDMPNTPPNTVTWDAFEQKRAALTAQAVCDWGIYWGASAACQTAELEQAGAHAIGLKMYCNDTTGNLLMSDPASREAYFQAWTSPQPISLHAEDETLAEMLTLVRQYHKRAHICHVATAYEVALLRQAKADGLSITAAVCPHHLFLTEADESRLGGFAMMKPTLKRQADQDALWEALRDGLITIVESDHAPHTHAEKTAPKPAFGVPGLQTTLPLLISAARQGRLPLDLIPALVGENPRRAFGVSLPPETYTLVDSDSSYTIHHADMRSACGWTPFDGMHVYGVVREVWIRGVKAFDGERVLVESGFGQNVRQWMQQA